MLKTLGAIITSRAAGPAASAIAVALAAVLAFAWSGWEARQAELTEQIVTLTQQVERSQALKAELAACHAAGGDPSRLTEAAYAPGEPGKLLEGPEGIDACARMENADRAVLSNLK